MEDNILQDVPPAADHEIRMRQTVAPLPGSPLARTQTEPKTKTGQRGGARGRQPRFVYPKQEGVTSYSPLPLGPQENSSSEPGLQVISDFSPK